MIAIDRHTPDPAAQSGGAGGAPAEHTYAVLGGVLRSSLELPDLTRSDAEDATWSVRVGMRPAPDRDLRKLGERRIGEERYSLWRHDEGFRLEYSHAGVFDISAEGGEIVWYPKIDASVELARAIVLGPAIALALEIGGDLCLHGSAVSLGGRSIAFLGGKFHGKSTIATALTAAGARLVSDDLLVVDPSAGWVRPGVASVRLWQDAAAELCVTEICDAVTPGIKTTASGFAQGMEEGTGSRLEAVYVLTPVLEVSDPRPCWRTPLRGAEAALALALQTKLPANLVGPRAAGEQLRRAAATAANVPVWRLHVVRDFARLELTVQQLFDWHTGGGTQTPTDS